jgi:hypothetical protein
MSIAPAEARYRRSEADAPREKYNLAALPLAAVGLLNRIVAGAAMAFSSVSVVTNPLRLRRFRPARMENTARGATT